MEKTLSEDGDTHGDGARAKVVGSIGPLNDPGLPAPYAYFVEWLDLPGVPVGIGGHRIRVVEVEADTLEERGAQ